MYLCVCSIKIHVSHNKYDKLLSSYANMARKLEHLRVGVLQCYDFVGFLSDGAPTLKFAMLIGPLLFACHREWTFKCSSFCTVRILVVHFHSSDFILQLEFRLVVDRHLVEAGLKAPKVPDNEDENERAAAQPRDELNTDQV